MFRYSDDEFNEKIIGAEVVIDTIWSQCSKIQSDEKNLTNQLMKWAD